MTCSGIQLELEPEEAESGSEFRQAAELLRQGLVAVVEKMIEEAQKGNVQAAKFIYPAIPQLLADERDNSDLWEQLIDDDAQRKD